VNEFWTTLIELLSTLGTLIGLLGKLLVLVLTRWFPIFIGMAWCLWGVNWRKLWPVLAKGAWLPLTFLVIVIALVWSQIAPEEGNFLGIATVPNFWWQLGDLCLLLVIAHLCGYIQTACNWTPAEIDLNPPAPAGGHAHH
jgi:hypothetical protein